MGRVRPRDSGKEQSLLERTQKVKDAIKSRYLPWVDLNQLFMPVAVLPAQFKPAPVRLREHYLMIAVLAQAFSDADASDPRPRPSRGEGAPGWRVNEEKKRRENAEADREDARAWFASDDREWGYSFVNICEALGLNPGYIRRLLGESEWRFGKAWRSVYSAYISHREEAA